MGEGNIGMESYLRTYIEKCPGRAVSLEIIVTPQPRMFNYRTPEFWEIYRNTPAWEFARFLALCEKGKPAIEPAADPAVTPAARQLANVEASIRWTQAFLAGI
jgi:3-oxoisoapionate decarboxylase